MWEQIYSWDETLTENDYRDALLYIAGDAFPYLSEEELEEVLAEAFNQIPEQYTEGVLNTITNAGRAIANAGKNVGSDAFKYVSQNPDLINTASGLVGTAIGGPIGGAIGAKLSGYATGLSQNQNPNSPEAKKELAAAGAAITNPQIQTALARGTLGIGNGATPVIHNNGMISLVPIATILRGLIQLFQKALVELDASGQIPNATLSESIPFAEDLDRQAEWLMEELLNY
jgi:hypothetical protein